MSARGRCAGICGGANWRAGTGCGTAWVGLARGSPRPRRSPSSRPNGPGPIARPGSSGASSGARSPSKPRAAGLGPPQLARFGLPPVKPVQRFVAAAPNNLWQIEIMGKVRFHLIGTLYLILAPDAHSCSILAGGFFPRNFRINLFTVMYRAFTQWGSPPGAPLGSGEPLRTHQCRWRGRRRHRAPPRAPWTCPWPSLYPEDRCCSSTGMAASRRTFGPSWPTGPSLRSRARYSPTVSGAKSQRATTRGTRPSLNRAP